jgi:hypothetical protein
MNDDNIFEISLWKSNTKYEFRIPKEFRDKFFDKNIDFIKLILPNNLSNIITIKIRKSFWNKCSHFGEKKINDWLYENNHVPYKKGSPPKFSLKNIDRETYKIL